MTESVLDKIRIVLVGPQHPGNIGAAARAMKVMGLSRLALVAPEQFPHADATARAAGADDLLEAAQEHDTLAQAVEDCRLVIGTSARERRLPWPVVDPRQAADKVLSDDGPAALVFGRERSGLTNEELDLCHAHLRVPCNPDYASLNLAAAVQLVCYELRMTARTVQPQPLSEPLATVGELEGLYEHIREVSQASEFLNPEEPGVLMRRLRRLLTRAEPLASEVRILRGLFKSLDPRRR